MSYVFWNPRVSCYVFKIISWDNFFFWDENWNKKKIAKWIFVSNFYLKLVPKRNYLKYFYPLGSATVDLAEIVRNQDNIIGRELVVSDGAGEIVGKINMDVECYQLLQSVLQENQVLKE